MTRARQERLRAYLAALAPHAEALRKDGWPVEVEVRGTDDGDFVVAAELSVDDTRTPAEAGGE